MPFSISRMIVDDAKNVVALDWSYHNADGTLSNQWKLKQPYGNVPLDSVTADVAVSWLDQLPNTPEELDAAITKRKNEVAYAETLKPYEPHSDSPPTPITMPAPVAEEK